MKKVIEAAVREALKLFKKGPTSNNIAKAAEKVFKAAKR
jgi:hypothetical protein